MADEENKKPKKKMPRTNGRNPQHKLNSQQEQFCVEYAISGLAGESARKSGYNPTSDNCRNQGYALLKKPEIQERIAQYQEEFGYKAKIRKSIADADELMEILTSMARGEEVDEQILAGGTLAERKISQRDRAKAIELLCRMQGAFNDKVTLNGDLGVNVIVDNGAIAE